MVLATILAAVGPVGGMVGWGQAGTVPVPVTAGHYLEKRPRGHRYSDGYASPDALKLRIHLCKTGRSGGIRNAENLTIP